MRFLLLHALRVLCKTLQVLQHSMWRVLWKPIQGALSLVGEPKWLSLKMGWETLQVRKPMWKALKLCGY